MSWLLRLWPLRQQQNRIVSGRKDQEPPRGMSTGSAVANSAVLKTGMSASEIGRLAGQPLTDELKDGDALPKSEMPPTSANANVEDSSAMEHSESRAATSHQDLSHEEASRLNNPNFVQSSPLLRYVPRASAKGKLENSETAMKHYQIWLAFVTQHRKVLDSRVKAADMRRAFNEKLADLKVANELLSGLLSDLQSKAIDPRLQDRVLKQSYASVLKQSYTVRLVQDQLEAEAKQLQAVEEGLVRDEWSLIDSLPEILQHDVSAEDISSIVRKQDIEFRGEGSYALETTTAEASEKPLDPEPEPETQPLQSKLNSIQILEDEIVSLRDNRARLMQDTLMSLGETSETREKNLEQFDRYDEEEKRLITDLKSALASLESFRTSDDHDGVMLPNLPAAEHTEKQSAADSSKQENLADGHDSSEEEFTQLFTDLRRLLHSRSLTEIGVYPESVSENNQDRAHPVAHPVELVNSWLLYQLRTSDKELRIYIDCLLRPEVKLDKTLSPEQILDHALTSWYQDITFKPSAYETHNTTNRTLMGGSLFLLSNAASLNYQSGRPSTLAEPQPLITSKLQEDLRMTPAEVQVKQTRD